MKKFESETIIEIPFYDVDPMNVVWHGNYIKYLENARCDLFKLIDYTYYDMDYDGVFYPIAKMDLKFIKSCSFGQKIKVKAVLEEIEPCIIIKYTISDYESGELLFKAKSMQICVDKTTRKSIYSCPEKLSCAVN
ncbi:acyl-CoA thioesterase [bacterium]|nr:acyl-CoA thioesterase [bacterium]